MDLGLLKTAHSTDECFSMLCKAMVATETNPDRRKPAHQIRPVEKFEVTCGELSMSNTNQVPGKRKDFRDFEFKNLLTRLTNVSERLCDALLPVRRAPITGKEWAESGELKSFKGPNVQALVRLQSSWKGPPGLWPRTSRNPTDESSSKFGGTSWTL